MASNLGLEQLKAHLFETIEGVKNISDPEASENEKITIQQAKVIADISGRVIDIYKVQVDALRVCSGLDNVGNVGAVMSGMGITGAEEVKKLGI